MVKNNTEKIEKDINYIKYVFNNGRSNRGHYYSLTLQSKTG